MRAYVRVGQLTEEEYQELKRWERSRKLAVDKVKRARGAALESGSHPVEIAYWACPLPWLHGTERCCRCIDDTEYT